MKVIVVLLIVIISSNFYAQTTTIPDVNFEQALIARGYDSGVPDGMVLTVNIDTVTVLSVDFSFINDLTGIEDFTALTSLDCYNNQLTNLNVTQNTALTHLGCYFNQLTSLDVTQNTLLSSLFCENNQLSNLDVTQNTALQYFYCENNLLANLNVTQNSALIQLQCFNNQMSSLNLTQNALLTDLVCHNNLLSCLNVKNGNNTILTTFFASLNPSLTCIEVDNVIYSTTNWTNIDASASFSTNCSNPCAVGIEEYNFSKVSLHPNPNNGQFTVNVKGFDGEGEIKVLNMMGQQVYHYSGAFTQHEIDLTQEKNGLYIVKYSNDKGQFVERIVKQ